MVVAVELLAAELAAVELGVLALAEPVAIFSAAAAPRRRRQEEEKEKGLLDTPSPDVEIAAVGAAAGTDTPAPPAAAP